MKSTVLNKKIRLYVNIFFGSVLVFAFLGCSKSGDKEKIIARVGNEKITVEEFEKMIENAPYTIEDYLKTDAGKKHYLDELLKEKIIIVEAKRQGMKNRPQVKKRFIELEKRLRENQKKLQDDILLSELLKEKITIGDSDVKEYYENNKEEFDKPVEIKASHILVRFEDEAQRILNRLKKGENFSKLAKELSVDKTTAQKGGSLEYFGRRQFVKEFEDVAFGLKKIGDISGIVKTPLGYHIIKLDGRKQLKAKKFEEVEMEIKQVIEKQKFDDWMTKISKKYKPIVYYELIPKSNVLEDKKNEK
ncbi:MAG TPA: hypothetical protein DCP53_00655 [Elusimicrobia bacterium]|nr:MAG: hypothetical protein A2551_03810 [Elusimicrobia bacterium RIFOXYD2_FULL_34_30]HAM37902.1 hypothetical protein [Elusimicrobiota bacterium]